MTNDREGGIEGMLGGPRNVIIALIGVILVAGMGIGAIAFEVLGRDRGPAAPTGQPSAAPQAQARVPHQEPACADPPGIEATSWEMTRDGLAVGADLSATCEDGNVLSGSTESITLSMGTRDIASGVFDLSAEPIVISPGGQESRTFIFPAGMYWRPPELIDDSVTTTITNSGSSSSAAQSSGNGATTLTAINSAPPAHGSVDGTAGNALQELRAADYPHVNGALVNRWVPQISSKRVGLVVDGDTFGNADILRNHLTLRQRYDDVRLVSSADWRTFSSPDFWVTVVGQPSVDVTVANRWCDSHGIDADNCFAKMISNTYGPEGTTVMRR